MSDFPGSSYDRWKTNAPEEGVVYCRCGHEYDDHIDEIMTGEAVDSSPCGIRKCDCKDFDELTRSDAEDQALDQWGDNR